MIATAKMRNCVHIVKNIISNHDLQRKRDFCIYEIGQGRFTGMSVASVFSFVFVRHRGPQRPVYQLFNKYWIQDLLNST